MSLAMTAPVRAARPRITTAVRMELTKLRRKRYWLMASGIGGLTTLWTAAVQTVQIGRAPQHQLLRVLGLLDGIQMLTAFLPAILGILASRLVTVDSEERMGQLLSALGQRETTRFVAKLAVLSVTAWLIQLALLAASVVLPGPRATPAFWAVLPLLPVVAAATAVAVSAVQLALSSYLAKQSVAIAVAAVGGIVISIVSISFRLPQVGWALPWGLLGAASPLDYSATQASISAGGDAVLVSSPWLVAAAAVAVAAACTAASYALIVRKENHR